MKKLYCHRTSGVVYEVANDDNLDPVDNLRQKIAVLQESAKYLRVYFEHLYKRENNQIVSAEIMFDDSLMTFKIEA